MGMSSLTTGSIIHTNLTVNPVDIVVSIPYTAT